MNKPRIGIYYDPRVSGRNDGYPVYAYETLKRLKEEGIIEDVIHLAPDGNYSEAGKLDLNMWFDWGEDALQAEGRFPYVMDVPKGAPLVYFASDTHLGPDYRFDMADKADFAFFGQKRGVEEYQAKGGKTPAYWSPHAVEPSVYQYGVWDNERWIQAVPKKEYDVCFIGHMNTVDNGFGMNRLDFLNEMFAEFPNFYLGTRGQGNYPGYCLFEDAAAKFNQSKISLNISIGDDINMRIFESLATKSFLLTNWLPTLSELFEDGIHLVTYKTIEEAKEKAHYYLEHQDEAKKIAQAGYDLVRKSHTYRNRILQMLTIAGVIDCK